MVEPESIPVPTPVGPARIEVWRPARPRGVLALGHGAGPSTTTVDLVATRETAVEAGWAVALVVQPWLVAGRRIATRAPVLDEAWLACVPTVLGGALAGIEGPLVVAGRSAGARVACRTASRLDPVAVLALSFPLHRPGKPEASRAAELAGAAAAYPVVVVQGERDPFGGPDEVREAVPAVRQVHALRGTHTIPHASAPQVAVAVRGLLEGLV